MENLNRRRSQRLPRNQSEGEQHNVFTTEGGNDQLNQVQNVREVEEVTRGTCSKKWPAYWTTFEGGYESDQRDSDDKGPLNSDEAEDNENVEVVIRKKKNRVQYPSFNERVDMGHVQLFVGLKFTSHKVFKQVVLAYSVQQHKDLIYLKNDKKQIHLGCAHCNWELTSGPDIEDHNAWQIKSLQPVHSCVGTFENRLITENWLVSEYLDKILRNPRMKPIEIKQDMKDRYEIIVSDRKCQRVKEKALNAVKSLLQKQYGILKPYLCELVKSNPGTTCVLKTLANEDGQPKQFQRFYVCYEAVKRSFKETCRLIIGLDGCFLKHACGGQLLCAVGRDGNNHMFPIAWAVVEREKKSSWDWFLNLLNEDLHGEGCTVVSDQQKARTSSSNTCFERRQCARHIFTNLSKKHKGKVFKKQFWECVKATSDGEYATVVAKLKELSQKAYEDFIFRDPNTFCKSKFKLWSTCDVVDNNMAETFNSFILLARYKPIVSMLEDIRLALMERMREKKKLEGKFVAGVSPKISLKLEEAYNEQAKCECKWNGEESQTGFEVHLNGTGDVSLSMENFEDLLIMHQDSLSLNIDSSQVLHGHFLGYQSQATVYLVAFLGV